MNRLILVLVLGAVVVVVVSGIALVMRPRVQRGLFAGSGVDRWRATASGLPWRDRWVLFWANSRGRAVPPRLAPLAVQRGEAMLAMTERMLAKGSRVRRFWWALGVLWAMLLMLTVARLATGHRETGTWITLAARPRRLVERLRDHRTTSGVAGAAHPPFGGNQPAPTGPPIGRRPLHRRAREMTGVPIRPQHEAACDRTSPTPATRDN